MDADRMTRQLAFLAEADKMKSVLRRTLLADGSRRENDAEHSWHFALMAMVLSEYAEDKSVDLFQVLRLALVHDLVEVYAGDTFAYDARANLDKAAREEAAADKIFGLLPDDQAAGLRALWDEFERMETSEAKFAAAIDRLQPFVSNLLTEGHTWREGNVTRAQVYKRMDVLRDAAPGLWRFVLDRVEYAVGKGWIRE